MRKRLLSAGFFALLVVLSAVLAGCGSQASSGSAKSTALFDPDVPRSDAPEAIDAELANRFIQTKNASDKMFSEEDGRTVITHKYGRTVLPENPQRIVVVGLEDTVVSLGIPIAAAHLAPSSYLYDTMKAQGIENIPINVETKTVNLEAVQQASPDIILLRDSYDRNTYRALSKIAPVVSLDLQKEEVTELAAARAIGQSERGEARLLRYGEAGKTRHQEPYRRCDGGVSAHHAERDPPLSVLRQCDEPVHV